MSHDLPAHSVLGTGGPVIVVLNGGGVGMRYWRGLAPALAAMGTVLLYDRPAPPPDDPAPGAFQVERLRLLRAALDLERPAILLAHSMGGLYAQLYARLFPAEVAGVILLDASHPDQERRFAPLMLRSAAPRAGSWSGGTARSARAG